MWMEMRMQIMWIKKCRNRQQKDGEGVHKRTGEMDRQAKCFDDANAVTTKF